jgi:hypothetical protein
LAILVSLKGELIASTHPTKNSSIANLTSLARGQSHLLTSGVIDGTPYLFVLVPLKAPLPIAWVLMGFAIDSPMTNNLAMTIGIDVRIVSTHDSRSSSIISTLPGSSRPDSASVALEP